MFGFQVTTNLPFLAKVINDQKVNGKSLIAKENHRLTSCFLRDGV